MLTVHEKQNRTYTQELFSKMVFGDVDITIRNIYDIASEVIDLDSDERLLDVIASECLQNIPFAHIQYQLTDSWNQEVGHHFLGELTQEEAIEIKKSDDCGYLGDVMSQYDYGGTSRLLVEWFFNNGFTDDYTHPIEILVFQGALEFLKEARYALWVTIDDQTKVITSAQKSIW